jgi:hypothetical protein
MRRRRGAWESQWLLPRSICCAALAARARGEPWPTPKQAASSLSTGEICFSRLIGRKRELLDSERTCFIFVKRGEGGTLVTCVQRKSTVRQTQCHLHHTLLLAPTVRATQTRNGHTVLTVLECVFIHPHLYLLTYPSTAWSQTGACSCLSRQRCPRRAFTTWGTHYTGSTSASPGYLSRLRPAIPNTVWKTSTMSPGRSANPPSSGSCSIQRCTHTTTTLKRLTWHCKMNCVSFWPSIQ